MSILDTVAGTATTAINPYLVYIKIFLVVLVVSALLGAVFYVKSIFAERDSLIGEKAALAYQLASERQKVIVAMEQIKIQQETMKNINAAMKNIRVQSDVYIQGVEDAKLPTPPDGTVVPFILPASTARASLPGFASISASRKRSTAP